MPWGLMSHRRKKISCATTDPPPKMQHSWRHSASVQPARLLCEASSSHRQLSQSAAASAYSRMPDMAARAASPQKPETLHKLMDKALPDQTSGVSVGNTMMSAAILTLRRRIIFRTSRQGETRRRSAHHGPSAQGNSWQAIAPNQQEPG